MPSPEPGPTPDPPSPGPPPPGLPGAVSGSGPHAGSGALPGALSHSVPPGPAGSDGAHATHGPEGDLHPDAEAGIGDHRRVAGRVQVSRPARPRRPRRAAGEHAGTAGLARGRSVETGRGDQGLPPARLPRRHTSTRWARQADRVPSVRARPLTGPGSRVPMIRAMASTAGCPESCSLDWSVGASATSSACTTCSCGDKPHGQRGSAAVAAWGWVGEGSWTGCSMTRW